MNPEALGDSDDAEMVSESEESSQDVIRAKKK
jgi:hypothetical protein